MRFLIHILANLCYVPWSLYGHPIVLRSPAAAVDPVDVCLVDKRTTLKQISHRTVENTKTRDLGSISYTHTTHTVVSNSSYQTSTSECRVCVCVCV